MASQEVRDAINAYTQSALSAYFFIPNERYDVAIKLPANRDLVISARFPGTSIERGEVGGDSAQETNIYFEDGSFRIDVFSRINPVVGTGPANQDTQIAMTEAVRKAFLGKAIQNVEIFRIATGLDLPAGVPQGWWTDSISCSFHYEHFGP